MWMEDDSVREAALTTLTSTIMDRVIEQATLYSATPVVGGGGADGGGDDGAEMVKVMMMMVVHMVVVVLVLRW